MVVRYLPPGSRSSASAEQFSEQDKEEINKINKQLVNKLKEVDSAFSIGIFLYIPCLHRFFSV